MSEPHGDAVDHRRDRYRPERLLMLVDGVFAISMTLLALDVRIPEDVPDTAVGFNAAFGQFLGRFGVFVAAFLITSRFWLVHHRQMAVLRVVDGQVAERTISFLAGITSLPVASSVLFRYGDVPGAVTFAALVLAVTAAFSARLWWYVSSPARDLADVDVHDRRMTMLRTLLVVVTYLLAIPIAYALPADDVAYAPLVWLTLIVVDRVAARLYGLISRRSRAPEA